MRTLFEISKSGLRSAERSLSVTSNNIVNAGTPGYSRQRVEKSPIGVRMNQFHAGLGVNITNISRLRDEMNDVLLNEKRQDMGYLQKKGKVFEKLEAAMVTDAGDDLDNKISGLFDSFSELSSDPQDESIRNNIISGAQQLTSKLKEMSRNIVRTSNLVKDSAVKTVSDINNLLQDVDELNASIQQAQAQGTPDHSSLDIRVEKLAELSELINFESQVTDTGAVQIRIGGIKVLDENQAYNIKPETDDVNKKFRLRLENGRLINGKSGKLGAEIEMYEEEIPDLKQGLDNVAATMVQEVNALHNSGFGLDDNASRNFFDPGSTTAATIQVNQTIIDNPRHIAASDQANEAGNGNMAAQIADLRNQRIISDGSTNSKIIGYSVDLISQPGDNLNSIKSTIETRDSEIQMLKSHEQQVAGVNIDEELSRMVKFQNAYQGAARVMSTAQEMYDTLISITR